MDWTFTKQFIENLSDYIETYCARITQLTLHHTDEVVTDIISTLNFENVKYLDLRSSQLAVYSDPIRHFPNLITVSVDDSYCWRFHYPISAIKLEFEDVRLWNDIYFEDLTAFLELNEHINSISLTLNRLSFLDLFYKPTDETYERVPNSAIARTAFDPFQYLEPIEFMDFKSVFSFVHFLKFTV